MFNWFPRMRRFITKYVKICLNCIYFKSNSGKKHGLLHPIKKIPKPFHTVHTDHLGPFVKTKSGNTQILLIIDAFTKFLLIYPVRDTSTKYVIKCFRDMMKIFGVPNRIISDQGTAFTSRRFSDFVLEIGTTHHIIAVGLPRGNGQIERYNRTLINSLGTMGAFDKEDRWDEQITSIQVGINGTLNNAIGVSPSEALMGFRVVSNPMGCFMLMSQRLWTSVRCET
jgi:transposase InsO family protein